MTDRIQRLKDLVTPKTEVESYYKVEAIETRYPGFRKIYIPHHPGEKLLAGLEGMKQVHRLKKAFFKEFDETNEERAGRRAVQKIKEYVLMNGFEHFATFTFSPKLVDRYDIEACKQMMMNWLKNHQKAGRGKKFKYVIVAELHEDGALHFHAAMKGYAGELKPSINPYTDKQIIEKGRKVFEYPAYTLGFTNVKLIDTSVKGQMNTAIYLAKYVTKALTKFKGKKSYWHSTGLKNSIPIYNPPKWYLEPGLEPDWSQSGEFGTTMIFNDPEEKA